VKYLSKQAQNSRTSIVKANCDALSSINRRSPWKVRKNANTEKISKRKTSGHYKLSK